MPSYRAKSGSVAYRTIAWLEQQPVGADFLISKLAEGVGADASTLVQSLMPAIEGGAIVRHTPKGQTRPYFYSLNPLHHPEYRETTPEGANRDVCAGQSHGAAGSEPSSSRGANGASELGAAPVFIPPRPTPQHVLKAKAATPDATDRGTSATASPGVGPMGAGQPADAGPITDIAAETAVAAPDVHYSRVFRYFCGVCWNRVREQEAS